MCVQAGAGAQAAGAGPRLTWRPGQRVGRGTHLPRQLVDLALLFSCPGSRGQGLGRRRWTSWGRAARTWRTGHGGDLMVFWAYVPGVSPAETEGVLVSQTHGSREIRRSPGGRGSGARPPGPASICPPQQMPISTEGPRGARCTSSSETTAMFVSVRSVLDCEIGPLGSRLSTRS